MLYKEIPHHIAFINQKSTIDLYVKIRGDYRLFAARGALLSDEQYRQFNKELIKLYFMVQDSVDPEESLDAHLMDILTSPEVSPQAKADIAYSTSMKSIQDVFQGVEFEDLVRAEKGIKKNRKNDPDRQ